METLIILGKYIAATAFLMIFYWIVLRHKASYRFNRIYLITMLLLGMVMSGIHFDLHVSAPVAEAVFQQTELPAVLRPQEMPTPVAMVPQQPMPIRTELTKVEDLPVVADAPAQPIDYETHLRALLLSISLLLLGMIIYHTARLWRIKRQMQSIKTPEGYDLYRSEQIATPFSFARSIFLPANLEEHREAMIIEHEKAHIGHRHYREVWVMEFLVRLCWFNPVVWLCRSELRNIHEYEADHEVLKHGTDLFDYQTTLLQMVMNESSPVVSGFNHSFIRQRFIEMKNSTAGTLSLMGKLGMVAWVSVLLLGFGIAACNIKVEPTNKIDYAAVLDSLSRLDKPELFTVHFDFRQGYTFGQDTILYIYLSDDFFHFSSKVPADTVHLIDHQGEYQIATDHVYAFAFATDNAGRLEEYLVPGETITIRQVGNEIFFDKQPSYDTKADQAKQTIRNLTGWKSPHIPQFSGCQHWSNPKGHSEAMVYDTFEKCRKEAYLVKDVFFTDSATVVNIVSSCGSYHFNYDSHSNAAVQLEDEAGNRYSLIKKLNPTGLLEKGIFGAYAAFEPLPKDVKSFSVVGEKQWQNIRNIHPSANN